MTADGFQSPGLDYFFTLGLFKDIASTLKNNKFMSYVRTIVGQILRAKMFVAEDSCYIPELRFNRPYHHVYSPKLQRLRLIKVNLMLSSKLIYRNPN
jgi:hypothetical protein